MTMSPNPFAGPAEVTVGLTEDSHLTLAVYNTRGRKVATLHDGPLVKGTHAFKAQLSNQPSGVYLVSGVTPSGRSVLLTVKQD